MHTIEYTYKCLLADVSRLTKFSEIRGLDFDLQWCLKEAPLLEKQLLECIEHDLPIMLDTFPKALRRLVLGSVMDPILLRYARQLLLFCYKASVPHDPATVSAAYAAYHRTNQEMGDIDFSKSCPPLLDSVRRHVQ